MKAATKVTEVIVRDLKYEWNEQRERRQMIYNSVEYKERMKQLLEMDGPNDDKFKVGHLGPRTFK